MFASFLTPHATPGLKILRTHHDLDVSHICGNPKVKGTAVLLEGSAVMRDGDQWCFLGTVRRSGHNIDMGRPLTYEQVLVMFDGYKTTSDRPRPRPGHHRPCPNRQRRIQYQRRFIVAELHDLRRLKHGPWDYGDTWLPLEFDNDVWWGLGIDPQVEYHYTSTHRHGACHRPLWRCDLTCPDAELAFVGPIKPYFDPNPVPF
jgi:hypothetical protein